MKHLKHMAIGATALFAGLLLFGVPLATALPYALLLACPVMMIGMMFFMHHGNGHSSAGCHHDHSHAPTKTTSAEPESGRRR